MKKSLRYLTVIRSPVRYGPPSEWGLATALFPVVGLADGALQAGLCWLGLQVWPQPVALLLPWLASLVYTRCNSVDGLADCGDALLIRRDRETTLRIIKDPAVGALGLLVVVATLTANVVCLLCLPRDRILFVLIAVPIIARWTSTLLVWRAELSHERSSLTYYVRGFSTPFFLLGSALTAAPAVLLVGSIRAAVGLAVGAAVAVAIRRLTTARTGGVSGDALGAVFELGTVAQLLVLTAHSLWPAANRLLSSLPGWG